VRILITGAPGTGKSTLAVTLQKIFDYPLLHTDSTIDMGWSERSELVATWFDHEGPWIIEGVVVPRALRKWILGRPGETKTEDLPFDKYIYIYSQRRALEKPGQKSMATTVRELSESYRTLIGDKWVSL
jgi:adenylate kinase family enzyme